MEASLRRPLWNQRAVDREVLLLMERLASRFTSVKNRCTAAPPRCSAAGRSSWRTPHGSTPCPRAKPYNPAEQQVVVQLLHDCPSEHTEYTACDSNARNPYLGRSTAARSRNTPSNSAPRLRRSVSRQAADIALGMSLPHPLLQLHTAEPLFLNPPVFTHAPEVKKACASPPNAPISTSSSSSERCFLISHLCGSARMLPVL